MSNIRFFVLFILVLTICLFSMADNEKTVIATPKNVVQVKSEGYIDWSQNEISARGIGLPPKNITEPAVIRVLAREAAITIATRNLAKIIYGVNIKSDQTVENLMLVNDTIKTKLEGLVKGAAIRQEKQLEDGSYEVIMYVSLYGKSGLADCISFNQKVTATVLEHNPKAAELKVNHTPIDPPSEEWTGIVIDCRGKKIQPTMEPCVLDTADDLVYPNQQIPKDFNMVNGLVSYQTTLEAAIATHRVGTKPLMIKATEVKGNSHPIISVEDSIKITTTDKSCHILSKFAVCFLLDQ